MDVCKTLMIFLGLFALCSSDSMMDRVYGEALLNSVNPALKEKLEDIHKEGVLDGKSSKQMTKIVKSRLTEDEVKELEAAYRRIIIPMLETTLESQFGKKVNLDDVDLEEDSSEDSSEEISPDEELDLEEISRKSRKEAQAQANASSAQGEKKKAQEPNSTTSGKTKDEL